MTPEQIAALIAALGLGAIAPKIVEALIKTISGKVGRERDAVEYERRLRFEAEDRADKEAAKRRKMQEYASSIRIIAIEHGAEEHTLPPWPEDNTMPRAQVRKARGATTKEVTE